MPLCENKLPYASSLFQIALPRCTNQCNSAFVQSSNRLALTKGIAQAQTVVCSCVLHVTISLVDMRHSIVQNTSLATSSREVVLHIMVGSVLEVAHVCGGWPKFPFGYMTVVCRRGFMI